MIFSGMLMSGFRIFWYMYVLILVHNLMHCNTLCKYMYMYMYVRQWTCCAKSILMRHVKFLKSYFFHCVCVWCAQVTVCHISWSTLFSRGVYFTNFKIAAIRGINFRENHRKSHPRLSVVTSRVQSSQKF